LADSKTREYLAAPKRERSLRQTGYTIAGYPFAQFGVPTILHSKRVVLASGRWKATDQDCGGIMKPIRLWMNDLPTGYELVIALQCQDCKYSDAIRIPYVGQKQLFNSTSNRTWGLRDKGR
jgi:hypothetical protein